MNRKADVNALWRKVSDSMTVRIFQFVQFSVVCALCLTALLPMRAAEAGGTDVDDRELNRSVEMDGLVIPVFPDGSLENYLFASARIVVGSGRDTWKYREKAHLIRDALILAGHRESLHVKGDIHQLDKERAEKMYLEAANAAIGEDDALVEIIFTKIVSKLGFSH